MIDEYLEAKRDGLDLIRTDSIREMRKYTRRIKTEAEGTFKVLLGQNPTVSPLLLARVALNRVDPRIFVDATAEAELKEATSELSLLAG